MKSVGMWNLRGLRPKVREAARDAARRSGMSVGEWLNTVIRLHETRHGPKGRSLLHAHARHGQRYRPERDDRDDDRIHIHDTRFRPREYTDGFRPEREYREPIGEQQYSHAAQNNYREAHQSGLSRGACGEAADREPYWISGGGVRGHDRRRYRVRKPDRYDEQDLEYDRLREYELNRAHEFERERNRLSERQSEYLSGYQVILERARVELDRVYSRLDKLAIQLDQLSRRVATSTRPIMRSRQKAAYRPSRVDQR
jgi:hypothetical protein